LVHILELPDSRLPSTHCTKMAGSGPNDPLKIFANIFISFIGAGVLGLPYAFKRAGLLEGIIVMMIVSYFAVKAMLLIVDCKYKVLSMMGQSDQKKPLPSDKVKKMNGNTYVELRCSDGEEEEDVHENNNKDGTSRPRSRSNSKTRSDSSSSSRSSAGEMSRSLNYSDIGAAAFGTPGRAVVDLALLTSQIGFCCAYLIFISENLSTFYPNVLKKQWLVLLLPPLFLLTLIKDLSRFAIFSLFAQISNLLAFTIVYWFDFQHLHLAQVHPEEFSVEGFPYYFSVAIYCFEGAGMILSLEESVTGEDSRARFKTFFTKTIVGITTLYITFGAAGYLSYGKETRDIITLNLPNETGFNFALLVKCCLCFSLFFTYPIMLFPVFSTLGKKLELKSTVHNCGLRLFIVLLTGLIVTKVPNFGELMALVGASTCTLLAFIMPAAAHLALFKDELTQSAKTLDYTLLFLGFAGATIGTLDTMLSKRSPSP